MLVANLRIIHSLETEPDGIPAPRENSPEEEENGVGELSPTGTDDLEPGVSVWGIEFEFCGKLVGVGSDIPHGKKKTSSRLVRRAKLESSRLNHTTTDRIYRICMRQRWIVASTTNQ